MLYRAFDGQSKQAVLSGADVPLSEPAVIALSRDAYKTKYAAEIVGLGYCVVSLEAALWCFDNNDDYAGTVLTAANLGDDAHTTAAIAGQVAGAYYGIDSIPQAWLAKLHLRDAIQDYAVRLAAAIAR